MKRILYFGATALGLLFASCQSDDINVPDEGKDWDNGKQTLYVAMSITGEGVDALSRADDEFYGNPDAGSNFQIGSDDENAINNVYFVFYDETGNVVGDIVPVNFNEWDENSEIVDETVEKSYSSVVSITLNSGEVKPSQVICYINPISPGSLNRHLNVIQTVARNTPYTTITQNGQEVKRFAMSNSVHYHSTDAKELPTIATEVKAAQLFDNYGAADAAKGDKEKTVNIYVERYATKLAFSAVEPDQYESATRVYNADGTYENKNVTLRFIPQYWALNAEAKTTYVIKSFRQESESGLILAENYEYGELNNVINEGLNEGDQWQWNRSAYHRSYWGMSPAYFTSEYPEVSSDLKDMEEKGIEPNQTYIPYDDLDKVGFPATLTAPQYFKETTVGRKALKADNPDAAVPHVIYVGRYNLEINSTSIAAGAATGANKDDSKNPSFYTYLSGPIPNKDLEHPYVYFDNVENSAESVVPNGGSMLKRFLAQTTILYKKQVVDGKDVYVRYTISNANDLAKLTSALTVSEVSKEVKENYNKINNTSADADNAPVLKLQNNTRTLQFKSAEAAKDIFILTGDGWCSIEGSGTTGSEKKISLLEANITLMRQVGYSYYYHFGHAYYNIPVKHFGWYRKGNPQRNEKQIDWSKVRVGDFGMVRNHSYDINVTKILDLAEGIGSEKNPIVPPANSREYYMAYSVRVLKWAVVPTQEVELVE